jgi:hypothetical protein
LLKFIVNALVTGRWGKKRSGLEVRTMMMVTDIEEESETSEMIGTSSEKRRLDSTREELREAGQEALRVAARKSGRRSVMWTMATTWPKSRSYRNS